MKPQLPAQLLLVLTLLLPAWQARAQLRLPSLNLPIPQRIGPLDTDNLRRPGERLLNTRELDGALKLVDLRLANVNTLLAHHRDVLEADPHGEPVLRHEILAWSPDEAALRAAAALKLTVVRRVELGELGGYVVLRVPEQADTAAVLEQLRARDPGGQYDFNHVYTGSGSIGTSGGNAPDSTAPPAVARRPAKAGVAIGLVDSGVDTGHAVFRDTQLQRWGCDGAVHPSGHGTAVAALMVGKSDYFTGVTPSAHLYAADIYCGADNGSGGSASRIADALAWLAREDVGVINLSLVGPPNRTLERIVAAMIKRGHVLVAAVGNDGPAAPPLYPASYPSVVGVTAVDPQGRPLPEAARGKQVMFAAPGSKMVSAAPGSPPFRQVRGTSFAAPVVAAMLANNVERPDPKQAQLAVAALARQASKVVPPQMDDTLGYGVVGTAYRADPVSFR